MEYFLLFISIILLILGIIGSILPALPGLPLSWFGLLSLFLIDGIQFSSFMLGITLFITLLISVLDYLVPAQGTKRFGGSKYGIWGTNIGLVIGMFTPVPLGFLIGPFVGALIGELLFDIKNVKRAVKAATGSLIGFLASTFIKLVTCIAFVGVAIKVIFVNLKIWF